MGQQLVIVRTVKRYSSGGMMSDELEIKADNIIANTDMSDIHKEFFKKSHELVFSQLSLTPVQHDVFALFLSAYHKENWDEFLEKGEISKIPQYEFHAEILCDWFGLEKRHLATVLATPCEGLSGKKIGYKTINEFDFIPLFSRVRYKNGILTISPNHQLAKAYIGVSRGHSLIPHKEFRQLKLDSSKRLYSILCRFKSPETILHAQSISELHGLFGLLDEKGELKKKTYAVTGNFIKRIIKPAIKEISETESDIVFHSDEKSKKNEGFAYVKEGRKVVGIKFLFSWKSKPKAKPTPADFEPTLEAAVRTHANLVNNTLLPSKTELDNLKTHMPQLGVEGFEMTPEFFARFKEAESATE